MFSTAYLDRKLMRTLAAIEHQIAKAVTSANEVGCPVSDLRYPDGRWVLNDLLLAKATTLAAMAQLKTLKKGK